MDQRNKSTELVRGKRAGSFIQQTKRSGRSRIVIVLRSYYSLASQRFGSRVSCGRVGVARRALRRELERRRRSLSSGGASPRDKRSAYDPAVAEARPSTPSPYFLQQRGRGVPPASNKAAPYSRSSRFRARLALVCFSVSCPVMGLAGIASLLASGRFKLAVHYFGWDAASFLVAFSSYLWRLALVPVFFLLFLPASFVCLLS